MTIGYPSDLYRSDSLASFVESDDEIGPADIARFATDGYLAVRDVLRPDEAADVLDGLSRVLTAPGQADIQYESWATDLVDNATGLARMDLVRRFMWFVREDPPLHQPPRCPAALPPGRRRGHRRGAAARDLRQ